MGETPLIDNQETEPLNKDDQDEEESKNETEDDIVYKPLYRQDAFDDGEEYVTFCSSILSIDYLCSVVWYLILCVRMSSWFAWIQTWSETLGFDSSQMLEFQYIKGTILTKRKNDVFRIFLLLFNSNRHFARCHC